MRAFVLVTLLCSSHIAYAHTGITRGKITRGKIGFNAAPTISALSSSSGGCPGDSVSITGTGFGTASGLGATSVDLNGNAAVFVVNSLTQITATIPNAATSGPWHVQTVGGTATSSVYTVGSCGFAYSLASACTSGIPTGIAVARSAGGGGAGASNIYAQNGANSVVKFTTAQGYVAEDLGDGGGCGVWSFPAYQNNAPETRKITGTGWTSTSLNAPATNAGADPFGTSEATFLSPTASGGNLGFSNAGPGNTCPAIESVWSTVGNMPSAPPFTSAIGVPSPSGAQLSTTNVWVRTFVLNTKGGGSGGDYMNLLPAGCTVTGGTISCSNASGGMNAWGPMGMDACGQGITPLVDGATGAEVISVTGNLGNVLSNNDINLVGCYLVDPIFVGVIDGPGTPTSAAPRIWSMHTPDGESFITWSDATVMTVAVNGDTINAVGINIGNMSPAKYRPTVACYNLYSAPSVSKNGFWWRVNGASSVAAQTALHQTYTMHTPTAMQLGSDVDNPTFQALAARHTRIRSTTTDPNTAEFIVIGDSQVAAYSTTHSLLSSWVYTVSQATTRPGIFSLATVGQTISQQQTTWDNSVYHGACATYGVKAVLILALGTNDAHVGTSEASMVSAYQALVNDVHANCSGAAITISPINPVNCASWATATIQNTILAFNSDIEGTGANNITSPGGTFLRMPVPSQFATGTLSTNYCWNAACDSGDHEHANDTCFATNGTSSLTNGYGAWVSSFLTANGLL